MLLVGNVDLQLVGTIGNKVTGIAPQLNRVQAGEQSQFPLVGGPTFLDVVHMAKALKMLVSLAMELEVGLEVGLVVTELAEVVAGDDNGDLVLSGATPVLGQMGGKVIQIVAAKLPANTAGE